MKQDVVLAGVGGQGVVSIGLVLAACARVEGFEVKMAEVHGMAQRGGSVHATLRISDAPIASALIPRGAADLVIATEPLEALRYADELGPFGTLVTSTDPHRNIPNYPKIEDVLDRIRALPRVVTVDARRLASKAGSVKAANLVIAGAASPLLPIRAETFREQIRRVFAAKGARVVEVNLDAFESGREVGECVAA